VVLPKNDQFPARQKWFELNPSERFDRFYKSDDVFEWRKIDVVGRGQQQALRP
jgi:hypothetical protein